MPRAKKLHKHIIRHSVRLISTDMKTFLGFGLTGAALILIFLTEGSQREAFILILAVLVAIGTLFFTFNPMVTS